MRTTSHRYSRARPRPTYVIEPNRTWIGLRWRELLDYRDLIVLLFRRDQSARFKQTILGPLWYVLQPLATALIFSFVFGRFAGITTDGIPRMLFYLAGLLGWNYFAQTLQATSVVFASNADLFTKVYFPRLAVPLASLLSTSVNFGLQLTIFGMFFVIYKAAGMGSGFHLHAAALLLPLVILQIAAMALGAGLWLASLSARYRDLRHGTSFIISSLLFLTPVIYPLSSIPEQFHALIQLNPMSTVVECFRLMLLGAGTVGISGVVTSVVLTGLIFYSGLVMFQRTERTVVDTV